MGLFPLKRKNRKSKKRNAISVTFAKSKGVSSKSYAVKALIIKVAVTLVLCLLIAGLVYSVSSIVSLIGTELEDELSGSDRIQLNKVQGIEKTLIAVEDDNGDILAIYVVILNENSGSVLVYYIPPNVYMHDFTGGIEAMVLTKNLFYAAEMLDKSSKVEYLVWQVQNSIAVKFDSYYVIRNDALPALSELFEIDSFGNEYIAQNREIDFYDSVVKVDAFFADLISSASFPKLIFNSEEIAIVLSATFSNETPIDFYRLLRSMKSAKGGLIYHDLGSAKLTVKEISDTEEVVRRIDYYGVDEITQHNLDIVKSKDLLREQVKVEVYNASGISKAAGRYSRYISNSGCTVLRYGNAPELLSRTTIFVSDHDDFKGSLDVVLDIFPVEPEIIDVRPDFMTTGDIVVLLGGDLAGEMSWE